MDTVATETRDCTHNVFSVKSNVLYSRARVFLEERSNLILSYKHTILANTKTPLSYSSTLPSLSLSLKNPSMIPAFGNGSAKTSWTGFSSSPSLHNVRLVSEHCQYCIANILIPLLPSSMKPASSSLAFIFNRWNPRFLSYL